MLVTSTKQVATRSVRVVEHGDVRDSDDRCLGGLQPGYRLTPRFLARWMQQLIAGLLEFACCGVDRVGVRDVKLDADLRHRPLARPFRRSEASLGGLRQRSDPEGLAAGDLLTVEVLGALER